MSNVIDIFSGDKVRHQDVQATIIGNRIETAIWSLSSIKCMLESVHLMYTAEELEAALKEVGVSKIASAYVNIVDKSKKEARKHD